MSSRYDYHKRTLGESYYGARPVKKKSKLGRLFGLIVFFAMVAALFIYVFPEAEVTVVPKTEAVSGDYEIIVDADLAAPDAVNNKISGTVIIKDDSMEKVFITTGEKNIGEKAAGQAVFYNQTGLNQPVTTENSLVSDDGIVFNLTANIEIPKAEVSAEGSIVYGTLTADIMAKEAGEDGNINPGRLTLVDLPFSKQNKIYGEAKAKLTGGTTKIIKVVSPEDLDKAEKQIKEQLEPQLRQRMAERLSADQVIYDDSIKFQIVNVEKAVELEEEVDEFKVKVNARAEALVWDEQALRDLIINKIKSGIASDKQLVETSQDIFEIKVEEFNLDKKTAKLKIRTANQISMPIDIEGIRDELKGKTEAEARRLLLGKDNIKDVRFKFNYSITSKVPNNGNRIIIQLSLK